MLLQSSLFVKNCFEKKTPNPFINCFQNSGSQHSRRMRSAFKNCPFVPNANTDIYGKKFKFKFKCQYIDTWNKYQNEFKIDLLNGRAQDVKKLLTENLLKSYLERQFFNIPYFLSLLFPSFNSFLLSLSFLLSQPFHNSSLPLCFKKIFDLKTF